MTLSADWQAELRSTVMGTGTAYKIVAVDGFGVHGVKANDYDRVLRHGSVTGADFLSPRVLSLTIKLVAATATTAGQALTTLKAAWRPSTTTAEVELDVRFPGTAETSMKAYIKPRGAQVVLDQGSADRGVMVVQCLAHCLDPMFYGAAVATNVTTTQTVTNAGNMETDRCIITITGSGGTPTLTNAGDSSGTIVFNTTLAGATTRILDLRTQTMTDNSGNDKTSELASSTNWFVLQSGANSCTLTGATSAAFSHRPAYV